MENKDNNSNVMMTFKKFKDLSIAIILLLAISQLIRTPFSEELGVTLVVLRLVLFFYIIIRFTALLEYIFSRPVSSEKIMTKEKSSVGDAIISAIVVVISLFILVIIAVIGFAGGTITTS